MTTPSRPPTRDNNLSSFTVGLALGVVGALLFGTEEGRNLVKKAIDAIPDKYKRPPVFVPPSSPVSSMVSAPETTHHTAYTNLGSSYAESPPPPEPFVRPSHPEPFKPTL